MAKILSDSERAHSGKPGAKVRHGADATGKVGGRPETVVERWITKGLKEFRDTDQDPKG